LTNPAPNPIENRDQITRNVRGKDRGYESEEIMKQTLKAKKQSLQDSLLGKDPTLLYPKPPSYWNQQKYKIL
jgi:hypothetical protein